MPILSLIAQWLRRSVLWLRVRIDRRLLAYRRPNTIWLPLRGPLPEHQVFRSGAFGLIPRRRTLLQLLSSLSSLAEQDMISTVVLVISGLGGGLARTQNVAQAVTKIREAGINVIALLENGAGLREYLIAAEADSVVMPPGQVLNLVGLRAEYILARGLLDKLAIEPEILAIGKYKAAGEILERKQLSKNARRMAEDLIEDTFASLAAKLAERRNIDPQKARELLGMGPYRPEEAKDLGLIDEVQYPDELRKQMKERRARTINPGRMLAALQRPRMLEAMRRSERLAIFYATGQIMPRSPGPFGDPVITPRSTIRLLNRLAKDKAIKGVVLRVSSPGGSASASDAIWRAAKVLAEKKPLVASFGDVAASGGYYIAMAAKRIFAEPSTLTGSIGVVGGKLNLKGLYEKLGVNKEIISRGEHADLYSDFAGLTPATRDKLKSLMTATYDDFVAKASQGRGMEPKKLDQLAQGRVYTGGQALGVGLVDEIGGLDSAVKFLKGLVGIPEDRPILVAEHPRPKTAMELIRGPQDEARGFGLLPESARRSLSLLWSLTQEPIAALCLLEPPEG